MSILAAQDDLASNIELQIVLPGLKVTPGALGMEACLGTEGPFRTSPSMREV